MDVEDSQNTDANATAEAIAKEAIKEEKEKELNGTEPPELSLTYDEEAEDNDDERLCKEALNSIPDKSQSMKGPRETNEIDADKSLAKARSEAEAKKAMLEHEATKNPALSPREGPELQGYHDRLQLPRQQEVREDL